ncbi:helix-turn-helix domain-containing protein [Sphingosinicella terrae]|uniref:helix-turn-helix domain-containing protein n=1 Tax=Sphingosinicella terrae TaxID=2172047 RepID=UPI000E0DB800|nr:helix-turn-helix transcriptional regulator [Sphingosinicella terrae]
MPIIPDRFRQFIFPNRMRELRRRHGFPKLLALAAMLPDIPYIRLSKIERGEVVARPDEIVRIAGLLGVEPTDLLIDVDSPEFDMASWSEPFQDSRAPDEEEERFAIMLAAAMRIRRAQSSELTIAALDKVYGLPPVILSRIENAFKTLDRWNDATVRGLCRVFGVENARALRQLVQDRYRHGLLDDQIGAVADPEARLRKTRERVSRLAEALATSVAAPVPAVPGVPQPFETASERPVARPARLDRPDSSGAESRLVPVLGVPIAGGLIAPQETGHLVEAPRAAGPRAFGLRICRPSLGLGLPGSAVVVADPDVFPASGGLALLREQDNYRLVAITFDRNGAMIGHSVNPDMEIAVDAVDPSDVAAVLSAVFA